MDIYQYLEPLLNDYRKLKFRGLAGRQRFSDAFDLERIAATFLRCLRWCVDFVCPGWKIMHMDEFIDELLSGDYCCDVALPHLPKRHLLEDQNVLGPRMSGLDDDDQELLELAIEEEEEAALESENENEDAGEEVEKTNGKHEGGEERRKRDRDGSKEKSAERVSAPWVMHVMVTKLSNRLVDYTCNNWGKHA